MADKKQEELTAVFESEKIRTAKNWCVMFLEDGKMATGICQPGDFIPGVTYRFIGAWGEYNGIKQFNFRSFVQVKPHSRRGVILYLEKFAPGIGPSVANQLFDLYGEHCISVLKTDPVAVSKTTRLTVAQARRAADALRDIECVQETKIALLDLLSGRGFYSECIDLAIKKWGAAAPEKIKRDPFCLLWHKFPGAGFSRVDELYQQLGHPLDRLKRQVYCAVNTIEKDDSGSTWVDFEEIVRRIEDLVTGNVKPEKACKIAVKCGLLVREDRGGRTWFALRRIGQAEMHAANRVKDLLGEEWFVQQKTHSGITSTESQFQESQDTNLQQSAQPCPDVWDF